MNDIQRPPHQDELVDRESPAVHQVVSDQVDVDMERLMNSIEVTKVSICQVFFSFPGSLWTCDFD